MKARKWKGELSLKRSLANCLEVCTCNVFWYCGFSYAYLRRCVCVCVCVCVCSLETSGMGTICPSVHPFKLRNLLTPWCRVLLEKLTGLQLVKKFPAFHGTRRFITALTSVRHLSLSCASPIQSIYPHPTSWRYVLISTHLRLGLPSGLFPSGLWSFFETWKVNRTYSSLLAYLLTPWCRVLLEKLTGLQLVKKFPTFHGTRRFITAKNYVTTDWNLVELSCVSAPQVDWRIEIWFWFWSLFTLFEAEIWNATL